MIEKLAEAHAVAHGVTAPLVSHAVAIDNVTETVISYIVEDRSTGDVLKLLATVDDALLADIDFFEDVA